MPANPRQSAFSILARIDKEHSFADILLDRELSHGELQGADRGLLTELVYGVLRRRGTLDHIINQFSLQRVDRLERAVLTLLRLGLYQLFFLDRIPASAAVNETVKIAHGAAPRAAGFINAVLRQADRADWIDQLGATEAEELCRVMSEAPPLTIRVNTLRISREALLERLAAEGATAVPARYSPVGAQLSSPAPFTTLPSFQEGFFSVQDEASQLIALLLAPAAGDRLLDLCAAPGGKAACLAEQMGNRGSILACDLHPRRLEQVRLGAQRLGIDIISTRAMDAADAGQSLSGELFTRVLVDAPCSGLGVLRRNPEGKWWKTPQDVAELTALQTRILASAAECVAEGGLLVYATCSTTVAVNEAVVDDFLSHHSDFVLENVTELFPWSADLCTGRGFFRSWPHRHGMDGFCAARLRKSHH
ncbi:MAG: 16S rRNA (cytosine(967)-C(5))-methyltransferase RsmB [Geobacter sp.]|nr:16S rRNA (cytosine(967)-C(5))-methyltransferase RsmB [Geobacter sp.]